MKDAAEKYGIELTYSHQETVVQLVILLKYHFVLADKGIKFCWGLEKRFCRNLGIKRKKMKRQFKKCVREAAKFVKKEHAQRFSAKCRRSSLGINL